MLYAIRLAETMKMTGKHFDPDIVSVFQGIAHVLYGEIGQADKAYLQVVLKMIIGKYF